MVIASFVLSKEETFTGYCIALALCELSLVSVASPATSNQGRLAEFGQSCTATDIIPFTELASKQAALGR